MNGNGRPGMAETLTLLDLFAGAGGMSLGFQRAGFSTRAAYDNWDPAVSTYRKNLSEHVHRVSITSDLDVPDTTVIVGGPPCQGFSSAGMRRGDDERNTLVGEYARLVARVRPVAFVFENVEGFLTGANGLFVFELLAPLIEAGYRIHVRKVNAAQYGVPQHRKRVIAIGGLGWDPSFPLTTHAAFGAPGAHLGNGHGRTRTPTLEAAISTLPPASASGPPPIPDHSHASLQGDDLIRARLLKPGQTMRDLPEDYWHKSYRTRAFRRVMDGTPSERRGGAPSGVRRLRSDEPSKAITGGSLRDFLHPVENRPLTIRECAVLQTFPIDFRFTGTRGEKMQMIGNAVPPLLAQRIATNLRADLQQAAPTYSEGALLSFIPTLSSGKSPILADVTRRVMEQFGTAPTHGYTRALWD